MMTKERYRNSLEIVYNILQELDKGDCRVSTLSRSANTAFVPLKVVLDKLMNCNYIVERDVTKDDSYRGNNMGKMIKITQSGRLFLNQLQPAVEFLNG